MRIKCLILTTLFLLPCLTVNAVSDTSADLNHERHSSLLSQLHINDGISKEENADITRAEFIALVVRAMNVNDISSSEEYFTDCGNNAFKREIFTAKSLGVTNGTSQTTFSPDEGVTAAAAAKMLITALGHKDLAEVKGGYPQGYLTLAYSYNIFDGVVQGGALTVKDAYTLIYNTILADTAIIDGVNGKNFVVKTEKDRNLLTENFHLTHIRGIVVSAGGYSLISGPSQKGIVCVSGTTLNTDDDLIMYFGLDVDVWYDDTDTVKVILETDSNSTVTVEAEDIEDYVNNVLYTINEKGRKRKYNLDAAFSFVKNGRVEAHTGESFIFDEGELTLIDNDDDGKYDIVLAQKPEYFIISGLNGVNKTIYDKYSYYTSISFEDDVNKCYYIEINGEPAGFSDLSENMVCEIYMSTDMEVCLLKANENSSFEGTLEKIMDDEVIVNGSAYKLNSYFKNSKIDLKPGNAYTFMIAPDATVANVVKSVSSDIQYGYVLWYGNKESLLSDDSYIKLLTADNSVEVFAFDSKIIFNGKTVKDTDVEIENKLTDGNVPKYQLVRFRAADGVIKMLDTEKQSSLEEWSQRQTDNAYDSLTKYVSEKNVRWSEHSYVGIPNVSFDHAVTFFVPKDFVNGQAYDYDSFFCGKPQAYLESGIYTVDAYDYDVNFCPGAVIVYYTDGNTSTLLNSISSSEPSYIVREISDAVDSDGEIVKMLKVYGEGRYKEFPMTAETYSALLKEEETTQKKAMPTKGDIIRLSTNTKGFINGIALDGVYDRDSNSVSINFGSKGVYETGNEFMTYFTGRVLLYNGSYMLISAVSVPSDSVWEDGLVNLKMDTSPSYVVYNVKRGLVRAGTKQDVVAGFDKNDPNASFVVVRTMYFNAQTVFIYEN